MSENVKKHISIAYTEVQEKQLELLMKKYE